MSDTTTTTMTTPETLRPLVARFLERAAADPERVAYEFYPHGTPRYATTRITWGEWAAQARAVAGVLLATGAAPGERVAILSGNAPLWPIADLGITMAGLISVGLYPTSATSQVAALLKDCGARTVIVDTLAHLEQVLEARARLSHPLTIVCEDLSPPHADPRPDVHAWSDWVAHGAALLDGDASLRRDLQQRLDGASLDDVAILIYTSGSTGEPKGACISHRYLAASAACIADTLRLTADDSGLSFLPFCHAAERVFGLYTRLHAGMPAALVAQPSDVFAVAKHYAPTVFGGLPRLYEKIYEAAEVARRDGGNPRAVIAAHVGARCRVASSGGAVLPENVARALAALGLPVLGAYGQTEHLCIAMNRPDHVRFDSVGTPMSGTEVRVADDGELLVRRSALTFSGYWGREQASSDAFTDDGAWLRTGDLAAIDADGMLRVTGRVKELIALSTGKKVAPLPIEAVLTDTPFIAHAVCHGEGRKFLSAVLSLRRPVVESWARSQGLALPWAALVQHATLRREVAQAVDRVNAERSPSEQVHRFAITDHEFTVAGGELTPTLKVLRSVVEERFRHILDALYES